MALTNDPHASRRTWGILLARYLVGGCGVLLIVMSLPDLGRSLSPLFSGLFFVALSAIAWLKPALFFRDHPWNTGR